MLNAARVHGRTMMVIAMTTAAIIQATAIHRPPNTIHKIFGSKETGDIPGLRLCSFSATMAHPSTACQFRLLDGLTGFSSMSLPCFSTNAFALFARIESSQGSCTSSLT